MCGIAGIVSISNHPISDIANRLKCMNDKIAHRGPDGEGIHISASKTAGLAHRRLAIIDLSSTGAQPMIGNDGAVLVHNGEVYNYVEIHEELASKWAFKGHSDTETILAAHANWGDASVEKFRGMFAYAHWDETRRRLFIARDPFGIKPLYYAIIRGNLYFASEIKAILPFLPSIETDADAFADYVTFQFPLSEQTMFKGVLQLMPGCTLVLENGNIKISKYWDIEYNPVTNRTSADLAEEMNSLMQQSMNLHLRADVPVGAYVSGGIDSSLIAILSANSSVTNRDFFHGKFTCMKGYDESHYAQVVADAAHGTLHQIDITSNDMFDNLSKVIYHLDQPVAGPGSFPQYMVSKLCAESVKVVLGGQGGDEIFGGYTRYAIGYLEHALACEIDGIATPESTPVPLSELIKNLGMLREYKPMMKMFFGDGMFDEATKRYFRLIGRSADLKNEIRLNELPLDGVYDRFNASFNRVGVKDNAVFDKMTRFDFNHLLPALLQVEDRMGMAHGLESRVPFLDKPIVEFAANLPMREKFSSGETKKILKTAFENVLPHELLQRRDKMGFPVPIKEWFGGELKGFVHDIFCSQNAKTRPYINHDAVIAGLDDIGTFSRKLWGLLSLELWHQNFHDKSGEIRYRE